MSKITSWMGYSLSTVVFAASLAVVGIERAIAEPAEIFRPIMGEIQQKLPPGMVMRLPSSLEVVGFDGKKMPLYPVVRPYSDGIFKISFGSQPNCEARACQLGMIAAIQQGKNNKYLTYLLSDSENTRSPVNLGNGIRGLRVHVNIRGVSTRPYEAVIWKQDNLFFVVTVPSKNIISIAASMAKEPSIASVGGSVTASNTNDKSCITWSRYIKDLPSEGGRGVQWWKYGQFPAKFQQGCVALDDGNAIDRAWILQSGLDIKPYSQPSSQSYQKLPIPTNINALDRLVNQGKAVLVTWLTPTNGSLQYLRSIPKDRPFLRDDGMTCLNTVCLKSAALSHGELSQILSPGIAKSPQPSSPSDQTASTPASSMPSSCAAGQFAAKVPPDPKYGNQSPSYAFLETAGRNGNGKRSDGTKIAADTRCIFFRKISTPSNPKQTWVVTHGWNSDSSDQDPQALAKAIAQNNPGDRVLMLDWGEASFNKGGKQIGGQSIRGVYYAATWIRPVAEVAVQQLQQQYGINADQARSSLNLVGHSLGSLMSAEIGAIYPQGVNAFIALDPASEVIINDSNWVDNLGGYDVDGRTPAYDIKDGKRIENWKQNPSLLDRPKCFSDQASEQSVKAANCDRPSHSIAKLSRTFVGQKSFAGNQGFAISADESYQADFGNLFDLGSEHGNVVKLFTNMVNKNSFLGFLGTKDLKLHPSIQKGEDGHSGIIKVDSANLTPKEIVLEHSKKGSLSINSNGTVYARSLSVVPLGTVQTIFGVK